LLPRGNARPADARRWRRDVLVHRTAPDAARRTPRARAPDARADEPDDAARGAPARRRADRPAARDASVGGAVRARRELPAEQDRGLATALRRRRVGVA